MQTFSRALVLTPKDLEIEDFLAFPTYVYERCMLSAPRPYDLKTSRNPPFQFITPDASNITLYC